MLSLLFPPTRPYISSISFPLVALVPPPILRFLLLLVQQSYYYYYTQTNHSIHRIQIDIIVKTKYMAQHTHTHTHTVYIKATINALTLLSQDDAPYPPQVVQTTERHSAHGWPGGPSRPVICYEQNKGKKNTQLFFFFYITSVIIYILYIYIVLYMYITIIIIIIVII